MSQVVAGVDHQIRPQAGQLLRSQACLRRWPGRMWMSLMCSTRIGVEPGVSTGMVISRVTNAFRSMTDA